MRLFCTLGSLALAAGGFALFLPSARANAPAAAAAVNAAPATTPPTPPAAAPANYEIDTVHSAILFRAKHMNFSHAWGRFDKFSGSLSYDEKDPAACAVRIEVEAGSVNSGDEGRDKHLVSNDFFNAKQFPKLSFASSKISAAGAGRMKVEGELEMLGVKKPVSFEIVKIGEGDFPMDKSHRVGFDAAFTIKRGDFGMKYGLPDMLGDEVALTISLEGIRK